MASRRSNHPRECSSTEREGHPSTSRVRASSLPLPDTVLHDKVHELVDFVLLKYNNQETTTKAEMLHCVLQDCQEHFPRIFSKASECLYMVFGIDVKEPEPPEQIYALVPVLDLTYNRMLAGEHGIPKTSLLIIILSIIFIKGNHVHEEVLWEMLGRMQVYEGQEHYAYGEPRQVITEHLVQEGYLVYRQVPDSSPARYEFLWGPRAHAETTKLKVLEHLAKVIGKDPQSYPRLYAEALREEPVAPQI
ncbi:melanoma-associated antigen 10-like [Cavia porcellus]|uniref:melanoma-associated antigen 10-like n=1 Tax=Cavia porcellus TaxID=10141 RepID=UPI00022B2A0D|nr:melanoma-associated antigen 10-like [Cavia porcellus]